MITRIIRWLFVPHYHHWELIEKLDYGARGSNDVSRREYVCRCKDCGTIKRFE